MVTSLKTKPVSDWTEEERSVYEQEENRKRRKRDRQNRRRAMERDEIQRVLDIPEDQRTDADREIIVNAEKKRPQVTQQKRERMQERRRRAEDILQKPESERTEDEVNFLSTYQAQRWRKVEGDRIRRLKNKLEKEGKTPEEISYLILQSRRTGLRKKLEDEGKNEAEIEVALMALGQEAETQAQQLRLSEALSNIVGKEPASPGYGGIPGMAAAARQSEKPSSEIAESTALDDAIVQEAAALVDSQVGKGSASVGADDDSSTTSSTRRGFGPGERILRQSDFRKNRQKEIERIETIPEEMRTEDERKFLAQAKLLMKTREEQELQRRTKRKSAMLGLSGLPAAEVPPSPAKKKKIGMQAGGAEDVVDPTAVLDANNERARARYSSHMHRIRDIKSRPKSEWTEEEKTFVSKQEERIARKNALSKQRRLEQKQEVARILGKPESERSEEEVAYLNSKQKNRMQKIEGDRLRRLQYKNVLRQDGVSKDVKAKAARAVLGRNLEDIEEAAKRRKVSSKKTIRDELLNEKSTIVRRAVIVDGVATVADSVEYLKTLDPSDLSREDKAALKKAEKEQKDKQETAELKDAVDNIIAPTLAEISAEAAAEAQILTEVVEKPPAEGEKPADDEAKQAEEAKPMDEDKPTSAETVKEDTVAVVEEATVAAKGEDDTTSDGANKGEGTDEGKAEGDKDDDDANATRLPTKKRKVDET
mmetsp:Transcript_54027/g.80610  ORF Transcript_54027/g.80610 Transcript_54027/m.80610 type:complete len:708 (-) Transcript_54027:191-2314(-)